MHWGCGDLPASRSTVVRSPTVCTMPNLPLSYRMPTVYWPSIHEEAADDVSYQGLRAREAPKPTPVSTGTGSSRQGPDERQEGDCPAHDVTKEAIRSQRAAGAPGSTGQLRRPA